MKDERDDVILKKNKLKTEMAKAVSISKKCMQVSPL